MKLHVAAMKHHVAAMKHMKLDVAAMKHMKLHVPPTHVPSCATPHTHKINVNGGDAHRELLSRALRDMRCASSVAPVQHLASHESSVLRRASSVNLTLHTLLTLHTSHSIPHTPYLTLHTHTHTHSSHTTGGGDPQTQSCVRGGKQRAGTRPRAQDRQMTRETYDT